MQSSLSPREWEEFWIRAYLGRAAYLDAVVHRAYLDLSRTLHGIGRLSERDEVVRVGSATVRTELEVLAASADRPTSQETFDRWHRKLCADVRGCTQAAGLGLTVGQAQKWVNMTMKYVFALGESRLPGYSLAYPWCHVPIDNLVLHALVRSGFARPACPWSRMTQYEEYMRCQLWIRRRWPHVPPLDVECRMWLGQEVPCLP